MIKQLGQLDLFHLVLSPVMCLPFHLPSNRLLPSRTLLPCHRPTAKCAFDFPPTSFSLQPPFVSLTVNRQCLPFAHSSYPWFKPPTYLIFARQCHQPPHFKVYSNQPLQLLNALHFGCTGSMYTVVKVSHPSMHLSNLSDNLALQYTGKLPTFRNI